MSKVIVNLSTNIYERGRKRLIASMEGKFDGSVITFTSESEVGAPFHGENPYAFKVYAIEKVRDMGYTQVLWLDASCYAVKNVSPIFDWIKENGIFMEAAGHWTGSWSNDSTLGYFGITREQAMQMPMFSAGFLGFDFEQEVSKEFFQKWKNAMLSGCFKGEWSNHRHDMTCGSIIACQMGLDKIYSEGGNYLAYRGEGYAEPKESVLIYLENGTH
jgi:hypothetical protein